MSRATGLTGPLKLPIFCPSCGAERLANRSEYEKRKHQLCRKCSTKEVGVVLTCPGCGLARTVQKAVAATRKSELCIKCSGKDDAHKKSRHLGMLAHEYGGRREQYIHKDGYKCFFDPQHPLATSWGLVFEHHVVVYSILGDKFSPKKGHVVHHIDGDKLNNSHTNLVVCEGRAYHSLLHSRQEALRSVGDASKVKCSRCQKYDTPESMYWARRPDGRNNGHYHKNGCKAA